MNRIPRIILTASGILGGALFGISSALSDEVSEITVYTAEETLPVVSEKVAPAPQNLSRAEKARRARIQAEIKNEDLLQSRLEEMRLQDEQRRSEQVLRATREEMRGTERAKTEGSSKSDRAKKNTSTLVAPKTTAQELRTSAAPMTATDSLPVRPILGQDADADDSYKMSKAPLSSAQPQYERVVNEDGIAVARSSAAQGNYGSRGYDQVGQSQSSRSEAPVRQASDSSGIYVAPRLGLPVVSSNAYNFTPKYLVGAAVGFELSESFTLDLGLNYSQVGVTLGSGLTNQFGASSTSLTYRQTAFDITSKWLILSREYRFRPFVGGGVGYAMGSINYDQQASGGFTTAQNTQDYQLRTMQGILQTGADYWLTPYIALQLGYRYIRSLSSTEREGINNNGFFNTNDPNKAAIRGSIRNATAHQVAAGFQFLF